MSLWFDWRPLSELLMLSATVGLVLWMWILTRSGSNSTRMQRLAKLSVLTLFMCFDLILIGSFTRLSDSGLGCPDWPGCYGWVSPVGASASIDLAQSQMPTGPVTTQKAWIEMVHRYTAMTLGFLISLMVFQTWALKKSDHKAQAIQDPSSGSPLRLNLWLSVSTLGWVLVQGLFGALTVTTRLFPLIVSLHLMGGMVLLVLLVIQTRAYHVELKRISGAPTLAAREPLKVPSLDQATKILLKVCMVALVVQIFLGAWVSTNYAVLACEGFPSCQGSFWPEMNLSAGFVLWRPLGFTANAEVLEFKALVAIHFVHRAMALLLTLLLLWLIKKLLQAQKTRWASGLALLLFTQVASGLSNVVLGWPLLGALVHTAGAAGLVMGLTWFMLEQRASNASLANDAHLRTAHR
jgi:cytochrome c oxidase assembly protein subunit 15